MIYRAGINDVEHIITKIFQRFGRVDNKSAADIIGEITKQDVVDALGYTPADDSAGIQAAFRQDGYIED